MYNILSKFVSILVSFSAAIASLVSYQSAPAVQPTLAPVAIESSAETTQAPVATAAPTAAPNKQIQDVIDQINDLKQQIEAYTPEPVPTPQVVFAAAPTATPSPTPVPDVGPVKVLSVEHSYNIVAGQNDGVLVIKTDKPARIHVSYIVDDGSIMADYASGSKDNDRLSAVVARYAATSAQVGEAVTTLGTKHIINAGDLASGHVWFAIQIENATGQIAPYLVNGNLWDWNNNFNLEIQ